MASTGTYRTGGPLIIAAVVCAATVGIGLWLAIRWQQWGMLAAGSVGAVLVLTGWSVINAAGARRKELVQLSDRLLLPMNDRLQQLAVLTTQISEQQLLSDRAKSVAYRSKDREALRKAIREDMIAHDWEAAKVLANEMEAQFGYKQEADRLREEINNQHETAIRQQIGEVLKMIDRYTQTEQWGAAIREAEKLAETYGDHELVRELPQEIEKRREATKQQLLAKWHERNEADYDASMELLKRLDIYLTPQEGEALQDSVRELIKAKLSSLREQFSSAWQQQRYVEALAIAEQITGDFPNAKIAQEMEEKMATLRQRANEERQGQGAPQTASA